MKVTFNWLKEYVDFEWSPEELAERLTMLGLEVEGVRKVGGEFEGVVVAQVISREKHPNADKLSLCRVDDGRGERQIVCGAQNFKAGDKVPLILPGASLPKKPNEQEPFTIKIGKIRGVESHGMLCSPQELGLPDAVDGLLILREDAKVGQPFSEYLGRPGGDFVYDLEVTPNRPDLNSVIGIAREIAAAAHRALKIPPVKPAGKPTPGMEAPVSVQVEAADLCPRYSACIIRGVKPGPSPQWLRSLLEKVGVRSINNIVDATNYVMMETGQPLHAFDFHLVASGRAGKPTLLVRRAAPAEKFVTPDAQPRELSADMLLIADETKAIALAGVMGGQNSEIRDSTRDVLLESACFNAVNIRRTSKALGLRTDASYRFERGVDIGNTEWANRRCASLILELAGGEVQSVVDSSPIPPPTKEVTLRHDRTNALLGVSIPASDQRAFLHSLGLESSGRPADDQQTSFRIPSWRIDLKSEVDLIEEVGRLYGVDRIPSTPPGGGFGSHPFDKVYDELGEARQILCGLGFTECQGQTLISEAAVSPIPRENTVALANPLSSDMSLLRGSLLPGLLASLKQNANHKVNDLALYEIGRVFRKQSDGLQEARMIGIALTGERHLPFWSSAAQKADAYDLKGALEVFLDRFGLRGFAVTRQMSPPPLYLESALIQLGKLELGVFGQLQPRLARDHDLRDPVFLAELDLDLLLARRVQEKSFKALPHLPAIRRDVAMVLAESITHEAVLQAAKQGKAPNLESVELFDVFRGRNVPAGQKSVAYAFTYRGTERTLTDAEVNSAHEKLVEHLKTRLPAEIRA